MAFITDYDQSNKTDWILDISATDATPGPTFGDDIDFTGAAVAFAVKDERGCQVLSATIGSGITQPSSTVLAVAFTDSQMKTLCPGSYNVGCVAQLASGEKVQVFVGSISIYDGVASL